MNNSRNQVRQLGKAHAHALTCRDEMRTVTQHLVVPPIH
jgi:hypothetical protein